MINRQKLILQTLTITAIIGSLILCVETLFNWWVSPSDVANLQIRYIRRGIEYIFLNIIYVAWLILRLRQNRRESKSDSFRDILKATVPFLIIAWVAYPQTSDIYLYLQYGLMNLKGMNPFLYTAKQLTSNISPLLVWDSSSTYGPVAQIFFMFAAYFTKISITLGVYIFKIICLLFHGLNGYLIWHSLNPFNYRIPITIAYLVNPVLLFDTVSNAHLDVFICTSFILFFICFNCRYYIFSILAIWMGLLTKILPIFWLPLVLVFLVRQRLWKSVLVATCLSFAIVVILSLTVLPTGKAWLSLLNPGVVGATAGSLHNILSVGLENSQGFLPDIISGPKNYRVVMPLQLLTYVGYLIYYATMLFKVYFRQDYLATNSILDLGWVTLFLFLFATPWYQPWYASILLPMIVLNLSITTLNIDALLFVAVSFIFSLSSTSYYLLAIPESSSLLFGTVSLITIVPAIIVLAFWKKFLLQSIYAP